MKIYLASFETQRVHYGIELDHNTNLFLTYYYKEKTNDCLPSLKPNGHKGLITIDSGAHSFFGFIGKAVTSHLHKKDIKNMADPYIYFEEYLQWAKENYKNYDYFVELDLQEMVGYEQVEKWRERYKKAGIFDKCITVYHSCDGWENYERLIKNTESGYIGLEGLRGDKITLNYNKYIKYAYEKDIKVHGFAFTRFKLLHQFPFYSVDSSSWTATIRYGQLLTFQNNKLINVKYDKAEFLKYNIPLNLHNSLRGKNPSKIKLEFEAKQYMKMQNYLDKLWIKRGIKWKE